MEFNQLILKKLNSLFTEHGLEISEQLQNTVKYGSDKLVITLIHDPRENSNTLWVGRNDDNQYMLDGNIVMKFFIPDLENTFKIPEITMEDFVNNVFLFFNGEGKRLLEGDESALDGCEKFNNQRSSEYTAALIEKQNLEAANKAWKDGNYLDVIKYLEKMNKEDFPDSLKQKYKIAQQRLGN